MTGLPADDRKVLDDAAAAAAKGQTAAEGTAATVGVLAGLVRDLIAEQAAVRVLLTQIRDGVVLAVTDVDHPNGAAYLVQGLGASKTWISDPEQWADLVNGFPWLSPPAPWAGRTLSKIPTKGEDPTPPSQPAD